METFSVPAPGGDTPVKALRGSDVRRSQESNDRTPVDRGSVQTQPSELPTPMSATIKDSPAESRIASSKLNSLQQPFPLSLPPAESTKTPRTDDVSPKQASTAKSSSTHARSRSSSPPPSSSSLRGHTGLGVELPEPHVNGSSGSSKKSQQDGDRDRDRIKATTSKEVLKSSKASSGGSSTPKERKVSKKEPVPDRFQDDDVVIPQKASKSSESKKSHDMDEDMPSPKLPSKAQSSSKKNSSSAQSQGSSLKKRFSRPAELEDGHLGSTGSKAQEAMHDSTSGHDRTTSSESSRGKPKSHSSSTKIESEQPPSAKAHKSSSSSSTQVAREEDVEMEEQPDRGEGLYCICRTVYDPTRFMIACDGCDDWFHGDCVGVAEKDSDMVDKYYCKRCEEKGRYGSLKKKCFREVCQKSATRKSKYCSKECGLLVATQRIQESQVRVFGDESSNQTDLPPGPVVQQQHLQRRRRLTIADLDDRQRLLGIREKMSHVAKVCTILDERTMQLEICVDRQARQHLGKLDLSTIAGLIASSSPTAGSAGGNNGEGKSSGGAAEVEDEDEGVLRTGPSQSKSKVKAKAQKDRITAKDKDKDALCGFDHSLVWDDDQDISRKDRAALNSLVSTPVGSRASSIAPPSFGVVVVNPKRQHNGSAAEPSDSKVRADGIQDGEGSGAQASSSTSGDVTNGAKTLASSLYLETIGRRVCMSRRNCDRHNGWQKLKASELELEKTTQNKLLKALKAEAKLVKSRMKRRRDDISARILNGTIEH
ncbi:hypothetical protein BGZ95_001847 [Linnemannia exigua]|uniref:PHD-type domain-containing protein n=1 Tax=Linnemannia exigua TaxID=604196 RepID=A0AAD4H2G3_9FUNG|nr:hypothetical protein BGZ95_001847 [Linnemannia exigua]